MLSIDHPNGVLERWSKKNDWKRKNALVIVDRSTVKKIENIYSSNESICTGNVNIQLAEPQLFFQRLVFQTYENVYQ